MPAESIRKNEANVTRFYVLSKEVPNSEASDRMVLVAAGDVSCLSGLMEAMAETISNWSVCTTGRK